MCLSAGPASKRHGQHKLFENLASAAEPEGSSAGGDGLQAVRKSGSPSERVVYRASNPFELNILPISHTGSATCA